MNEHEREVLEEIQRILTVTLEATETVTPADRLSDNEVLDSLGLITLAVGLENRFRVRLSEEDALRIETFGDVIDLVNLCRGEEGR